MSSLELAAQELALLQAADRLECEADPVTFVQRHCTIEGAKGEVIPFKLWPFQVKTLEAIHREQLVIVLKSRRLGLSWLCLSYALWLAIFSPGVRILILCKNEADASELLARIRRMRDRMLLDPLSAHLLADIPVLPKIRNKVTVLDIGASTIKALVGTPAAARSETAGFVIVDEFAFQRNAAEIWRGLYPTIEGGGKIAMPSTGDGVSGDAAEFAEKWSGAVSGANGFHPLFWPWDSRPDRDDEWKRKAIAAIGSIERFKVEYPEQPDDAFLSPDSDMVYPLAGIDAAERLGREMADLAESGELEPVGGVIHVGIDWGEYTHSLIVWELEAGGLYIAPTEVAAVETDPAATSKRILEAVRQQDYPLGQVRWDAAGIQSMRTFRANAPAGTRDVAIPFGKFKAETIKYLRSLFRRSADGERTRIIAIHPSNTELLRQLRALEWDNQEQEKVAKVDDHGPDALIAVAAQIAARNRELIEQEIQD